MASVLFKLASMAVRRRWFVITVWALVVVGAVGAAVAWSGPTSDSLRIPGAESQRANDLLAARFPEFAGSTAQVVLTAPEGATLSDPEVASSVSAVLEEAAALPDVVAIVAPTESGAVSADGRVGLAQVVYDVPASEVPKDSAGELMALATEPSPDRLSVAVGGEVPSTIASEIGLTSELIGLSVALVVLLLTFGSLVAAGLPLITGVLGVAVTYSVIYLVANIVDLPSATSTLAVMIGLAVGIDYSLFIVSRHREELATGMPVDRAAGIATATAGSAVIFAGMSVVVAIAGLAVVGIPFLTSMGFAAAGGVLLAMVMAVTLTPALLSVAGGRILRRRERHTSPANAAPTAPPEQVDGGRQTLSVVWARAVLKRPVAALVGSVLVLGLISAPALDLRLGFPDDTSLAEGNTRRAAFETIEGAFGPGYNAPLALAVDLSDATDTTRALDALDDRLATVPGIVAVADPVVNGAGDTALVTVVPSTGPATSETEATLAAIRDLDDGLEADTGARIYVTGLTATNIDTTDALERALLPFLSLVLGLMLVLLVLAFRSIVVAVKAVIAIVLSVTASFGVLVAVFQWGWLAEPIGVEAPLPLIPFLPIIMFAILFGLSMDYEVFILSRVRERITAGDAPADATLHGLGVSARVITAAALIMIAVFGSFIPQVDPTIKMFGVGLATAVLLDATIVRMVFVPAALAVLGRRAWQLSPLLDRILPDLDIEGHRLAVEESPATDTATDGQLVA